MADTSAAPPARKRGAARDVAPYVLIVGAVWLGWQVLLQPVMERGPPEAAIRVAGGSPTVLRRAAEAELIAADKARTEGQAARAAARTDNAAALARDGLIRAPFDVRALRVIGLTEARRGRDTSADDILTLAGNWSLRDDPSHAWLVEHRLKQGDYASAFAHADTLARRREDMRPRIFQLFTVAATQDTARALPVVTRLVAARPPWRQEYLDSLYTTTEGLQTAANLAVFLQRTAAPLNDAELAQLYMQLLDKGQAPAVRTVRDRLNRPPAARAVANGGFDDPHAPRPFQWTLGQDVGLAAEILNDEVRAGDPALRVEYDGYAAPRIAEQFLLLAPGRYRFSGEARIESGDVPGRMGWTLTCTGGDRVILSIPAAQTARGWAPFAADFSVPANCTGQWLRLVPHPGERRSPVVGWFDRVTITPVS